MFQILEGCWDLGDLHGPGKMATLKKLRILKKYVHGVKDFLHLNDVQYLEDLHYLGDLEETKGIVTLTDFEELQDLLQIFKRLKI